jgi:hypothetical protein
MAAGAPWLRRGLIAAAAFIVAGVALIASLPFSHFPHLSGERYPLIETLDWDAFARAMDARGWRARNTFVAATRWLDGGKLDYALHGDPPVLCLSDDPRGFGVIRDPHDFIGWDALIVAPDLTPENARARYDAYFDAIEPLGPVEIHAAGAPAIVLSVYRGKNFHDPAPSFSLRAPPLANPPAAPKL